MPSISVSRVMPACASATVFTFIRCWLACRMTTARVADTRSRWCTVMRSRPKKIGSKPQASSGAAGSVRVASMAQRRSITASKSTQPLQTLPSGAVRAWKPTNGNCHSPPAIRCECPSTRPGISTLSAKRVSSVKSPQACMRARSPTASTLPSRTATCVASGCIGFMVRILRAWKTVMSVMEAEGSVKKGSSGQRQRLRYHGQFERCDRLAVQHLDAPAAHPVAGLDLHQRRQRLRAGRLGHWAAARWGWAGHRSAECAAPRAPGHLSHRARPTSAPRCTGVVAARRRPCAVRARRSARGTSRRSHRRCARPPPCRAK